MSEILPGIIAQMRRLYLHTLSGAHITPDDLGRQIEKLEALQASGNTLRASTLSLEAAIDTWHATELHAGLSVPDFWDDCSTSKRLALHLTALGYRTASVLRAAIQTHHDTKHGTAPRNAAVLSPPDRALYTSAGIDHAVLGWSEGLDERRRATEPRQDTEDELFTRQPTGLTAYTFRVAWSAEDGEWVGTCDQLPSLSHLHHDPVEAAEWICSLVADYVDELAGKTVDV